MEVLLQEMIKGQQLKLLSTAQMKVPHITQEDILQPQDYPELEMDPEFRFEEGLLVGLQSALAAIRANRH